MITIEELNFIPKLPYSRYSAAELRLAKNMLPEIERSSQGIWVVQQDSDPLFVVGVQQPTFLGPVRLWFLLCTSMETRVVWRLRAVKEVVGELDRRFVRLETLVERNWRTGERFAQFCGFKKTDKTVDIMGRTFVVMER